MTEALMKKFEAEIARVQKYSSPRLNPVGRGVVQGLQRAIAIAHEHYTVLPPLDSLALDEVHPAARFALAWVKEYLRQEGAGAVRWNDAFARSGDAGGRIGEVCGATLRRVLAGEPVTERELLGLAWMLRDLEFKSKAN